MKWIVVLIPLILVFSGCVDTNSIDYQLAFGAGSNSRSSEVNTLEDTIDSLEDDIKWFEEEFERKSDVTREALGNQAELISEVAQYNSRLKAIEIVIENLDGNFNQSISNLNEDLFDLNVSIQNFQDSNHFS